LHCAPKTPGCQVHDGQDPSPARRSSGPPAHFLLVGDPLRRPTLLISCHAADCSPPFAFDSLAHSPLARTLTRTLTLTLDPTTTSHYLPLRTGPHWTTTRARPIPPAAHFAVRLPTAHPRTRQPLGSDRPPVARSYPLPLPLSLSQSPSQSPSSPPSLAVVFGCSRSHRCHRCLP
jgi:hypothetical protein